MRLATFVANVTPSSWPVVAPRIGQVVVIDSAAVASLPGVGEPLSEPWQGAWSGL